MKPLYQSEVAAIMKKEVPMLLHKRIAELESAIEKALFHGDLPCDTYQDLTETLNKGIEL